jgi:hypothetical protein
LNYRSTEIDITWLAQEAAVNTRQDVPLPGIVLDANPPEGLVNLATYFWVDPATYGGQPYSEQATVPAPWTVDWDYWVTRTASAACPPGALPGSHCTSTTQVLQHHHEDHLDVVHVTVTLTPSHYRWTFGDEGQADFADRTGVGVPYNAGALCCASLVTHNYLQSSFRLFQQGGFPIHLTATWAVSAIVQVTRDGAAALDETLALADRLGDYDQRYQVRESQPVIVQ